jgi:sulfotransferase family protein
VARGGTRFFKLRRAVFLVRRSVPRVARPLSTLVAVGPPERPIFLIGCPRSGTSALLQAFLRSPELATVQLEGHILWDEFHPNQRRDSDALGATDVSEPERRYVDLAVRLFARGGRFVDKTPENTLRIGYLDALFPDATFVFLRRRAADNVNSLIEGWRARPRFVTHRLPTPLEGIAPLDGRLWSFALLPDWRLLTRASLEEICAHQFVVCNESVLEAEAAMDSSRWRDLRYEDFVAAPVDVLRQLFASLDIPWSPAVEQYAGELDRRPSATAVTPPRPDKWREQNPDAIERILPLVRELEARLGYVSSAST